MVCKSGGDFLRARGLIRWNTRRLITLLLLLPLFMNAQKDSLFIKLQVNDQQNTVHVEQKIVYRNSLKRAVDSIKLLSWTNAYRNWRTPLGRRKLEERKTSLYFANKQELGYIENLNIQAENLISYTDGHREEIYLKLNKSLGPGAVTTIDLAYDILLPAAKVTDYGYYSDQILMKYFFIVPDGFENNKLRGRSFLDIDDNESPGNFWNIEIDSPAYFSASNLPKVANNHFRGFLNEDPELVLSHHQPAEYAFDIDGYSLSLVLGYDITEEEKALLNVYVPQELRFIRDKIGYLPEKIFLGKRNKDKDGFLFSSDIKVWKKTYPIFKPATKFDLNYFSMLSKSVVDHSFIADKDEYHWMYNGLKTYLEIEYLKKHYPDLKLFGMLPDTKVWKFQPLKWFSAADIKLIDRYGLAYQYILSKNLDQKISTPLTKFSKYNVVAISSAEMGTLFAFVSEKIGQKKFDGFVQSYFKKHFGEPISGRDFTEKLAQIDYSAEFLNRFIYQRNRVNFKLKGAPEGNNIHLKVSKNTDMSIPFKLQTIKFNAEKKTYWFDTQKAKHGWNFDLPNDSIEKLALNPNYSFPEIDFRDNYIYTKGFFTNRKKFRFQFITDIPNPEYNEVFWIPKVSWNDYDKFMPGVRITNHSLIPTKFQYSVVPTFSTGTGSVTGSARFVYKWQPLNNFFSSWDFGTSGSFFHYDRNLSYRTADLFTTLNFKKDPRSQINRSILFSYSYFTKQLSPDLIAQNAYGKYNLWNLGYGYSNNAAVYENFYTFNTQWMDDFGKISSEYYMRWEYARKKKLMIRFFGGYFLRNNTKNNLFDFGVSQVSNYAFNYALLGQSARRGVLTQQYILAEGGFKSDFNFTVNRWIFSTNATWTLWKRIDLYADFGIYRNKGFKPRGIWDSGLKLNIIPDFIELYFPIQSSLGFEPKNGNYFSRIRYMLDLRLSSIINHIRRGIF